MRVARAWDVLALATGEPRRTSRAAGLRTERASCRETSAIGEGVSTGRAAQIHVGQLFVQRLKSTATDRPLSALLPMAAQQPQAGDEPVWVKDDDEDLEELVDLNLDKEAESAAHARQIDLQVAPGCWR